jgi:hypothetical protein
MPSGLTFAVVFAISPGNPQTPVAASLAGALDVCPRQLLKLSFFNDLALTTYTELPS